MIATGPEWIGRAERVALTFGAATARERGAKHSVYIILLHDPRLRGRWGLYVGQTSRNPDWRFDLHKAGYKASGAVRRFGVSLLPSLVQHLNPLRGWESLELEAALAEAFRGRRPVGRRRTLVTRPQSLSPPSGVRSSRLSYDFAAIP